MSGREKTMRPTACLAFWLVIALVAGCGGKSAGTKTGAPTSGGKAPELVTRNYRVTVAHTCEEGCVSCNDIRFVCADKRTGKTIEATGSTMHSTAADGVTPSRFLGYEFDYGNCTYQLMPIPGKGDKWAFTIFKNDTKVEKWVSSMLNVESGDKMLVEETGKWRE